MKWFLILVMVGAAAAAVGDYYEPADDDPCCVVCGDPTYRSYDKLYLTSARIGKILLSEYEPDTKNTCKFQIRCVMAELVDGQIGIEWCGISVHPHKKKDKFFRNYVFGPCLSYALERGMGISLNAAIPADRERVKILKEGSRTHYFPPGGSPDGCQDFSETPLYLKFINKPNSILLPRGCEEPVGTANRDVTYKLFLDEAKKLITIRTPWCGWSVDFYMKTEDQGTCIKICQDPNDQFGEFSKKQGMLRGMCGNWDHNEANDWEDCDGGLQLITDEDSMDKIAKTCLDGDREIGLGITGWFFRDACK